VLKWVFEQVTGEGKSQKTPIGYMPTADAIDRTGLDVSEADMAELLKVDKVEWLKEVASIREHYAKFGDRLPKELAAQLDALEKRLQG
jgi:phosphoenolpyruvate carboxykinase (GTP)